MGNTVDAACLKLLRPYLKAVKKEMSEGVTRRFYEVKLLQSLTVVLKTHMEEVNKHHDAVRTVACAR